MIKRVSESETQTTNTVDKQAMIQETKLLVKWIIRLKVYFKIMTSQTICWNNVLLMLDFWNTMVNMNIIWRRKIIKTLLKQKAKFLKNLLMEIHWSRKQLKIMNIWRDRMFN